jgi:hypothetical protein
VVKDVSDQNSALEFEAYLNPEEELATNYLKL